MGLRIIHANTNVLMHNGMTSIVKSGGGIDELVKCTDEKLLLDILGKEHFDLVIIDYHCPNHFTVQSVFNIRKKYPDQKILIISGISDNTEVLQVLEQGAQGYLTYECDEGEIKHAIFSISKGEKFFCNKVLEIILNKHLYNTEEDDCAPTNLTVRENEITGLIARGLTNKQIAGKLFLSPHTVHSHRKNIMKKLGIKSTSELTVYAINVGLIRT